MQSPKAAALPPAFFAELDKFPKPTSGQAFSPPTTLVEQSASFVRQVAKVGKQQMKTSQEVSLLSSEVHEALAVLRTALVDKEEIIEMLRKERDGLLTQHELLVRELLSVVDLFEHALRFAQKNGDRRWTEELERIDKGMMQALSRVGLREIPALSTAFDPNFHEVIETIPKARLKKTPHAEAKTHDIVEVAQRGFHASGVVVRRAKVITAGD